jgi:hypothetical protein
MDNKLRLSLLSFCKSHETKGHKMSELFREYRSSLNKNAPSIPPTQSTFELGLLEIGKRVARVLQEKCLAYVAENGSDSYAKFIHENEYVTKEFWDYVLMNGNVPIIPAVPSVQQVQEEVSPDDRYEQLLPLGWVKMDQSERVEFVKKVQHKGFFEYLLASDKRLKDYFSRIKTMTNSMRLYVSLFSVPAENYSEEAKNLLKAFVEVLNMTGRARLQFVTYTNPDVIEVRELR